MRIGDDEMEVLVVLELRLHQPRPDPIRPPLDAGAAGVGVGRGQAAELGDGGSARVKVDLAGGGIGERLDGLPLDAASCDERAIWYRGLARGSHRRTEAGSGRDN